MPPARRLRHAPRVSAAVLDQAGERRSARIEALRALGASVHDGVLAAAGEVKARLRAHLNAAGGGG